MPSAAFRSPSPGRRRRLPGALPGFPRLRSCWGERSSATNLAVRYPGSSGPALWDRRRGTGAVGPALWVTPEGRRRIAQGQRVMQRRRGAEQRPGRLVTRLVVGHGDVAQMVGAACFGAMADSTPAGPQEPPTGVDPGCVAADEQRPPGSSSSPRGTTPGGRRQRPPSRPVTSVPRPFVAEGGPAGVLLVPVPAGVVVDPAPVPDWLVLVPPLVPADGCGVPAPPPELAPDPDDGAGLTFVVVGLAVVPPFEEVVTGALPAAPAGAPVLVTPGPVPPDVASVPCGLDAPAMFRAARSADVLSFPGTGNAFTAFVASSVVGRVGSTFSAWMPGSDTATGAANPPSNAPPPKQTSPPTRSTVVPPCTPTHCRTLGTLRACRTLARNAMTPLPDVSRLMVCWGTTPSGTTPSGTTHLP